MVSITNVDVNGKAYRAIPFSFALRATQYWPEKSNKNVIIFFPKIS